MSKPMRVALYARVSTKDQDCELQLDDLRRMAEVRQVIVVNEYVDRGVSGTPSMESTKRNSLGSW